MFEPKVAMHNPQVNCEHRGGADFEGHTSVCMCLPGPRAPMAQCRHLIYSWASPSDALDPLIYKTHQEFDKSLAEWLHGHRDSVQQAIHLTDEEKLGLPFLGAPKEPLLF